MPVNDPLQFEKVKRMALLMAFIHGISTSFAVLMILDTPSMLTPSGVMGTRAGHTAPEELSSKPNTIYDILQLKHPTIILIFGHFSALTIIILIHFIFHLIPQFQGHQSVGERLTLRKNHLDPGLAIYNPVVRH